MTYQYRKGSRTDNTFKQNIKTGIRQQHYLIKQLYERHKKLCSRNCPVDIVNWNKRGTSKIDTTDSYKDIFDAALDLKINQSIFLRGKFKTCERLHHPNEQVIEIEYMPYDDRKYGRIKEDKVRRCIKNDVPIVYGHGKTNIKLIIFSVEEITQWSNFVTRDKEYKGANASGGPYDGKSYKIIDITREPYVLLNDLSPKDLYHEFLENLVRHRFPK